ncbi:MAG: hypothetical protein KDD61_14745 [Bdellovibrionales bacterium]|nr:hypothetical protein [Bdellovibrionales bacterium]
MDHFLQGLLAEVSRSQLCSCRTDIYDGFASRGLSDPETLSAKSPQKNVIQFETKI